MNDRLSKAEIRKDALQEGVTAASQTVGTVTTIITSAVGDIARAVGGFATEMFEIRDSAKRASRDHAVHAVPDLDVPDLDAPDLDDPDVDEPDVDDPGATATKDVAGSAE